MDLDAGAIQAQYRPRFRWQPQFLPRGKDQGQRTPFVPTRPPHIDGGPIAKALGQTPPLATLLRQIQNGVANLPVGQRGFPPRYRKQGRDPLILFLGDFHAPALPNPDLPYILPPAIINVTTPYLKHPPAPAIGFLYHRRPNPQPPPARPYSPPQIGPQLIQGNDLRPMLRSPGHPLFQLGSGLTDFF